MELNTYIKTQEFWANAFKEYKGSVVPQIQTGSNGASANGAVNFMEVMGIKAARDLSLDMRAKD